MVRMRMPTRRRNRVRRWVYLHIPEWLRKRDFEVFTAFLCLTASIPVVFGGRSGGQAASEMPPPVEYGWNVALFIGPILVLLGIFYSTRYGQEPERSILWYRIEALGLTMLAYVGYLYTIAIMFWAGTLNAVFASAVILTFALTCHMREVQIQLDLLTYKSAVGVQPYEHRE